VAVAFGINVPIGLAVVAGTLLLVPESKEATAARGNDLAGALLSVLGFGGIIFGLIEAATTAGDPDRPREYCRARLDLAGLACPRGVRRGRHLPARLRRRRAAP